MTLKSRFFLAAVLLTLFGCATTPPMPVTIIHERKNHGNVAAEQYPKVADLIELLKQKKLISSEEAARFEGHAEVGAAVPNIPGPAIAEQTALQAPSEKGNETEQTGKKMTIGEIKEEVKQEVKEEVKQKVHEELPEKIKASNRERIEKMSTSVSEKLKKDIQDQIKDRIREEISRELKEKENEQIEKITTNVSQEIRKDLVELAKKKVWDELPEEIKKSRKEEVEKVTTGVTRELMKGVQEEVRKRVQQELPSGLKASERDRMENILSNVNEELRKSVLEEVVGEVQEELPAQIKPDEKEQIEKIAAKVDEELKSSLNSQISSQVQEELPKEEAKKIDMAAALPDWIRRIHLGGDIRLRYENDRYDKNNYTGFFEPSDPTQLMDTTINQDLYKYRVRLGAAIDVNDQLEAVVRLSTGNTTNPVSTNSILGTYFNKDNVLFDLAYLRWKPSESFNLYGGRIPNPFFSTDLVWSRDLNFEGVALTARKPVTESWTSFLNAGAFPLQQYDFSTRSKWLYAGQLGLEEPSPKGISYKLGASYYYYSNITGIANNPLVPGATDWTAPLYMQKGNATFNIEPPSTAEKLALASEFKEINITGDLDIGFWDPYHVVLLGDFVKNIGFNENDVSARTGNTNVPYDDMGYQVGLSVGHPVIENFGQWKAYAYYKYLEGDAVVDAFTDPDFHLGGTNAKGWIVGTDFAVMKNCWFTVRWLSANQISGPPLAIDVLQLDFNAKF